jgi:hypothetical protein
MLVSALSILSFVVLSPELGTERETDKILQQRSNKNETRKKSRVQEVEELLSVSRDASDGSLWSLLHVLFSLLDAVALRHPSKTCSPMVVSPMHDGAASTSWQFLKNRCFRVIKRFVSSSCMFQAYMRDFESLSVTVVPFGSICWLPAATVCHCNS